MISKLQQPDFRDLERLGAWDGCLMKGKTFSFTAQFGEEVSPSKWFRYDYPVTQVVLIALVCFCCPGMFNALSGMGGTARKTTRPRTTPPSSLAAPLMSSMSVPFSTTIIIRPRSLLLLQVAFWAWEADSTAGSVSDGTYIAFMCFMATGAFLSLALLPPNKVVRSDGSRATLIKYSNVSTEAMEILKLFFNWKMLLLVPASWASNLFYTYQFNNVNGKLFTVRTRGFNSVFYWGAQTFGSVAIGYVLDSSFQSRKKRGFLGLAIVAVLRTAVWGLLLTKPFAGFDRPQEDVGIHSLFKE